MITGFLTCSWGLIIFCKFLLDQWNISTWTLLNAIFWSPRNDFADIQFFLKNVRIFMVTPYGAKMSCTSNLLSAITESPWSQSCGIVLHSMICLSLVKPPYEQSLLGVVPTKTFIVFLFLYVVYVDFWQFWFLGGHSVPWTITLVVGNLALELSGATKQTTSWSGHRDTSLHSNDMEEVHVPKKLYTSDSVKEPQ